MVANTKIFQRFASLTAIVGWLATSSVWADTNTVTARLETFTNQFETYAQVEPIAVLSVQAIEAGIVTNLDIVPGASVQAGQKISELGGPEIVASLAQAKAAVNSAKARLAAAKKTLDVVQQQFATHLSTQQQVADAESTMADATGALAVAQAQLKTAQLATVIIAPAGGTVLAMNVANGQRVMPGQTVLTLQATNGLWLKAAYYGADVDAIRTGMTGNFFPANGDEAIPVKVTAVFGALTPDGGEVIGFLAATPSPNWLNGEFGSVILNGETRSLVSVPTRALILDKGKWWVLVQTPQGEQPKEVVPGPARGWQTFIESGLEPGAQIVEDAYLKFHRGIAENYEPPD
ncbi:MAG: efflux RND transporter periplasmic adaptor subunit [Limisphaerales bacterium]